uniref:Uncharacterized protein n=1 Tax=Panagrolaimus superbus TaxID=310955 RepID=A0A914YJC4_9BILA
MAQDNFAAFHIEKACAAIVDNSRYNKTYSNAISLLANVATDYMRKIATKAYALTEIAGDNETTVEHVLMAK